MDKDEITLRDYFAAKAMQAIITKQGAAADYHWGNGQSDKKPALAEKCYGMADAMIKKRNE
tara:strand:+ start:178 stop:360 length:183 start_codon:yes stop_codon:yes gene_type:complete